MTSSSVLQLDALLAPISDVAPAGADIRTDTAPTSLYYRIKDARNAARAEERHGLFDTGASGASDHWRQVIEQAPAIIAGAAKDLEIATWLLEALTRQHGFTGLRDGFFLIDGLIEQYWDGLYPEPDEDGIETRVAPLTGLNGEGSEGVLIAPIRNIPITEGQATGVFSYWQYQQALEVHKLTDTDARAQRSSALGFDLSDIEKSVQETPARFFVTARENIEQALAIYRRLGRRLDDACGVHDAPPTSNIINILTDVLGAINHIARDRFPSAAPETTDVTADTRQTEDGIVDGVAVAGFAGPSREEAFRQLVEISNYFRQTEPHSPLSYMLDKAVRWGRMPLHELIGELIPDSSSRDYYASLTGVVTDAQTD